MSIPGLGISIMILVLFSAFFSATETAFSSLNKTRIRTMAEKGNRRASLVLKLNEDYDRLLSTILIGNNIVNIACATAGSVLFVRLCGSAGTAISTAVITIMVLIFGEITPKSLAKEHAESFSIFSAPILSALMLVLRPLCALFALWKKLVNRVFKFKRDAKMSQDELLMLVDEVQQEGVIDRKEGELLRNAIEFAELRAKDILIHRMDITAMPDDSDRNELASMFAQTQYSRIPIYHEDIDHIVGVIHIKDLYGASGLTERKLAELIKPVVFVARTERIRTILQKLQTSKTHIAVVLDEFGGTCGMVTMEDILEELVGEIWDEHDEETAQYQKLDSNTWHVDGMMNMEKFCELFGVSVETDRTLLSGWLIDMFGEFPEVGSTFSIGAYTISVLALENHRIARVAVCKSIA